MKKRLTAIAFVTIWMTLLSCGREATHTEFKIRATIGKVTVVSGGQTRKPKVGEILLQGDTVITGTKSMAVLLIGKRGVINISQNTKLSVDYEVEGKAYREMVDIENGKIFVSLARTKGRNFLVKTPTVTASVRGTGYRVIADKEKSRVDVVKGSVRVAPRDGDSEGKHGAVTVPAGKTAQVQEKDRESIADGEKKIQVKKLDDKSIAEISAENSTLKQESVKRSLNSSGREDLNVSLDRLHKGLKGFAQELAGNGEGEDGDMNIINYMKNREQKERREYEKKQSGKK